MPDHSSSVVKDNCDRMDVDDDDDILDLSEFGGPLTDLNEIGERFAEFTKEFGEKPKPAELSMDALALLFEKQCTISDDGGVQAPLEETAGVRVASEDEGAAAAHSEDAVVSSIVPKQSKKSKKPKPNKAPKVQRQAPKAKGAAKTKGRGAMSAFTRKRGGLKRSRDRQTLIIKELTELLNGKSTAAREMALCAITTADEEQVALLTEEVQKLRCAIESAEAKRKAAETLLAEYAQAEEKAKTIQKRLQIL